MTEETHRCPWTGSPV